MAMCEEVKDFPIIGGGDKKLTLKDLMDLTPRGHFSKVMLEEKVFETWYSGRTVLIGDGMVYAFWSSIKEKHVQGSVPLSYFLIHNCFIRFTSCTFLLACHKV